MRRLLYPSARERRFIVELFRVLYPARASERLPLGAESFDLEPFLLDLFARAPLRVTLGLRLLSWVVWVSPIFAGGRLCSFPALTEAEQRGVLARMRDSSVYLVREIPLLFKMLAGLAVCGQPELHAALGLTPRDATPPAWRSPDSELEA